MNTDYEDIDARFERKWREQFSTFPPFDKMTLEEAEKFKEYTRRVYMTVAYGNGFYYK